jgi:hypothetical protein
MSLALVVCVMSQDSAQMAEWSAATNSSLEHQMVKCAIWNSGDQNYSKEHHNKWELASRRMHQANRSLSASAWAFNQGTVKFQWNGNLWIIKWNNVYKFPTYLPNLE